MNIDLDVIRIIKEIKDVDFALFPEDIKDMGIDDNDKVFIKTTPVHGTIIYVAGMIEDDPDSLICLGAETGTHTFRVALYPPFLEFEKGWFRLIGEEEKAKAIEHLQIIGKEVRATNEHDNRTG